MQIVYSNYHSDYTVLLNMYIIYNIRHVNTHTEFNGDFQHCFPLNSTSNNNSMLSQCYPDSHNSLSTYSSGIMQQSNQLHIPHDLNVSAQSDSNSMDVSGSQSVQQASPCAPVQYPVQQNTHTIIGKCMLQAKYMYVQD